METNSLSYFRKIKKKIALMLLIVIIAALGKGLKI